MQITKVAALLALCNLGCLDQEEGCLDALANNFEVSATENCCCTYPDLVLSISHLHDKDNLALGAEYVNALGQSYSILAVEYFLSDFSLRLAEETVSVESTIELDLTDGSSTSIPDDVVVVTRNQFRYPIGTLAEPGSYSDLQFRFGLSDPEKSADLNSLPEDHVLQPSENGLYDLTDETFDHLAVTLVTPAQDTVALRLDSSLDLPSVLLSSTISKGKGDDLIYTCSIDYAVWFKQIDLSSSAEDILAGIMTSIGTSVQVIE